MEGMIKVGHYRLTLKVSLINAKSEYCEGYGNRTQDGYYILALDYDGFRQDWVEEEMQRLAIDHDISSYAVLKCGERSYHVVGLEKMPYRAYLSLLRDSSADSAFKWIPKYVSLKRWVLRYSGKEGRGSPEMVSWHYRHKPKGKVSQAHLDLLLKSGLLRKDYIPVKEFDELMSKSDKSSDIYLCSYRTGNKVIL